VREKDHDDDEEDGASSAARALWCELVDLSDAWHELNSDLAELNDELEPRSSSPVGLDLDLDQGEVGPEYQDEVEEEEVDRWIDGLDGLDELD
jgi:hypothetical protein